MLPPLQFEPIYQDYIWGPSVTKSRLAKFLSHQLPRGFRRIAESWELVDLPPKWSSKLRRPIAGMGTLREVLAQNAPEVYGPGKSPERFPLLVKYLDVEDRLSVQVHPSDDSLAQLGLSGSGKDELWVVVAAEPSARIWAGFRREVSKAEILSAIQEKQLAEVLAEVQPGPGDCYFFPAGTVHAAGGGLLILEIQQASDVTFRLYDWDRLAPDGNPRPLHIEEGLFALRLPQGPVKPLQPILDAEGAEVLLQGPKFTVRRREVTSPSAVPIGPSFKILVVLAGFLGVAFDSERVEVNTGDVILLPWCLREVVLAPISSSPTSVLEVGL
ncbi:MAG: class I mannose-6-phosphate isomerase [Thermoguttaceae bacterium]|nr:class I mannose-6-phosphate isomerase [Thermoguttaceae bacterium]MDW8078576.1 class I mannose-6-phosphate isomerase [Thermoguttaceae bacterium]